MKKIKLLLITIIAFIMVLLIGNSVYAANTMNLNITDVRPYTSKTYTITTPNGNTHTIFKIIKKDGTTYSHKDALYCLRSGLGFGNTEYAGSVSDVEDVTYTENYNLKTQATSVMNYYRNTIGYNITNTEYNAMLWIIDNMYLPEHDDCVQMKERLIEKAKIVNSELTDDDIEFIQQMALWYFANYDENGGQNALSLADTYVLSNTTQINGEYLSETKTRQIDTLYRYFIDNAKAHVTDYGIGNSRDFIEVKPEIIVDTTSKAVTTDNGFVVIGPFNLTEKTGNVDYKFNIEVKDKQGKVIPEKVDDVPVVYVVKNVSDMVPYANSITEMIGQGEFYLKISDRWSAEFDLSDVNIDPNCTYDKEYKTTATLWLGDAEDQPVIKVEKNEIIEGNFNVNLIKVDKNGNLLYGAEFTMITEDREAITITNNGDGTFNAPLIQITEEGQEFIYEIEEISAPNGYIGINGKIRIKITTKLNTEGTRYVIDTVEFINAIGEPIVIDGVTFEVIDNEITIKVENEKIEGETKLQINKVDDTGNLLLGAGFSVKTIEGQTIAIIDNGDGTYSTSDIKITEEGQEFILSIKETTVPSGYIGIKNDIRLKIKTKLNTEGTRYVVDKASIVNQAGQEVNINGINVQLDNNIITITVTNEKIEGDFNVNLIKVDEDGNLLYGAEFTMITEEGKNITITNNGDGTFSAPLTKITEEGQEFIYEIEEISAPIGYIGINGKIKIKITTKLNAEGTRYVIDTVQFINATGEAIVIDGVTFEVINNEIVIKVENKEIEGATKLTIKKVDENGRLLMGAEFSVKTEAGQVIAIRNNGDGTFDAPLIQITEEGQQFIYEIEEISTPSGYIGINGKIKIKVTTKLNSSGTKYVIDTVEFINTTGEAIVIDGVTFEVIDNEIIITVENERIKVFDLALRKHITKLNGTNISNTKEPTIDTTKLDIETTADYKHRKDAVEVVTGDKITYKISVYNEGDIEGIVTEIIDYLPEGLEFDINNNPEFIEQKLSYTETEIVGKKYAYIYDPTTRALIITSINEPYLFKLDAFDGTNLDNESLEIVCTVTESKGTADKVLTNIATMKYEPANADNKELLDRDSSSEPSNLKLPTNRNDLENYKGKNENKPYLGDKNYYYKGQEDDDDFDKVVIRGVPFDLALRKFITKVNGKEITTRIPEFDTSKLNTVDETTGQKITTATYTHSKEPVVVKQGDIVTFTLRVYNEGYLDGYAMQIADYIPEGLGYLVDYKENTDNFWVPVVDSTTKTMDLVGTEGLYKTESAIKNLDVEDFYSKTNLSEVKILKGEAKIYTTALEDEIIKAYNPELTSADIDSADKWQQSTNGTDGLYYKDVEITCIVLAENTYKETIRNIAEVKVDKAVDDDDNVISAEDRDSTPDNLDKDNYNPPRDNSSYQEDDDDYELIELRYFDLALRKFITGVNDEEITTRIPQITINKGQIEYIHDKTPIHVANSDIVTYTIRVYNEGTVLGYATEVSDDIPDGLEFLPSHETNKKYKWVMIDKSGEETEDPSKAVEIRTRYLENELLNPYDPTKDISDVEPLNPDYADVKVAFKVVEQNIAQEDRIIINKAQITEDKAVDEEGNEIDIDDEDSIPDEWNEGEDDQDIEKIYVQKFDLALLKWVTKTIVTVDGKTTTTETGFTPYDNPEPIAKVVIDKKKLDKTTVKFVYNIMIMNQGEIAGYATEITDYIPEGLEFVAEDNPIWTKTDDNKITTRALEGTLLKPGEKATVEVVFTWKKDAENLGIKTNIAEISEDYNDKNSEDIDSDPDNVKPNGYDKQQEDDDDKALVMLEIKTGGIVTSYMGLILTSLMIITGGIILIKRFVI